MPGVVRVSQTSQILRQHSWCGQHQPAVKRAAAGGSRHNSVGLGPMRRAVAAVSRDVACVSPCESIELCGLPETGSQVGLYMHEASSGSRRQLVS